jgi:hypothetical protein
MRPHTAEIRNGKLLLHANRARLYRERALECRLVAKEGWAAYRSKRFLEMARRYERLAEVEEECTPTAWSSSSLTISTDQFVDDRQ